MEPFLRESLYKLCVDPPHTRTLRTPGTMFERITQNEIAMHADGIQKDDKDSIMCYTNPQKHGPHMYAYAVVELALVSCRQLSCNQACA
jgi:hypothetical protein